MARCRKDHISCSTAAPESQWYPTRLVDVGGGEAGEPLKLVTTAELKTDEAGSKPKYLTLSHCWGGANILKLLLKNVDDLSSDIPFTKLPKTFQDAVMITRQLGYVYHFNRDRSQ